MHFLLPVKSGKLFFTKDDIEATLHLISDDLQMEELWAQFQKSNFYVGDLEWKSVIGYVEKYDEEEFTMIYIRTMNILAPNRLDRAETGKYMVTYMEYVGVK